MFSGIKGKTALITGGSRGLGREAAIQLARQGANVTILARNASLLTEVANRIRSENGSVLEIPCDVTDHQKLAEAYAAAEAKFSGVDILLNNAGTSARKEFLGLTEDDLLDDYRLKILSAIRLSQLAIPRMRERKWGRIINVLSINGKAAKAASAPTSMTRAAGIAMTKLMAHEFGPWNIQVNALCIGAIKSGQWEERHKRDAPELSFEAYVAPQTAAIPLGRLGNASEFASAVCFLASDAASYITGTAINVDGGLSPMT